MIIPNPSQIEQRSFVGIDSLSLFISSFAFDGIGLKGSDEVSGMDVGGIPLGGWNNYKGFCQSGKPVLF
jgi:hypothetical protein